MDKSHWIDVVLLLTIGLVFRMFFSGISHIDHLTPDFTLAVLFVIIVLKENSRVVFLSVGILAFAAALTSSGEHGFVISLVERIFTGGLVYYLVKMTRNTFSNQIVHLCVIGAVGTIVSRLLSVLLVTLDGGSMVVTFSALLRQVISVNTLLNVGAVYVLYVTLQYGENILETQNSESS